MQMQGLSGENGLITDDEQNARGGEERKETEEAEGDGE